MMNIDYNNIPNELKSMNRWVCWNSIKQPINAMTGEFAKTNDSKTWCDFETAVQAVETYDLCGVGFVLRPPYFGIDLDTVRNPETNEICSDAQYVVDTIYSYTEISQSGTGLHIICRANFKNEKKKSTLPCNPIIERKNSKGNLKNSDIEMYHEKQYFALTGDVYENRNEITDQTDSVKTVYNKFMEDKPPNSTRGNVSTLVMSESDILTVAMKDEVFRKLWNGDTSSYQSDSEADLALCNKLAFYCDKNTDMMDKLFRQSDLMREKWNRDDYRSMTINKAITKITDVYDPNLNKITSDDNADDIEYETLTTWEELSNEKMLLNLYMTKGDIERIKIISMLKDKVKKIKKSADYIQLLKAVEKKIYTDKRDEYRQQQMNQIHLTDSPVLENYQTGDYRVDDSGVFLFDKCIIVQAILITKKFEDFESGTVKVELAYRSHGRWKCIIVDKEIIANKNKIITLASQGVEITTDTADGVVRYLQLLQTINDIPVQNCVSHLGYFGKRFVPYNSDLIYTGDEYTDIYDAIHSKGDLKVWIEMYKNCRNDNIAVRGAVASSFASVLLHPFGKLPFIFHVWGASDIGKTVASRLTCSVWGYHLKYMRNMNSTKAGLERPAYFVQNLPLILDEFQTAKQDKIGEIIYMLTEGQGRSRATPYGISKLLRWECSFITNGEQPLTNSSSNTGEINRIIDVPVTGQIFKNPSYVYSVCDENYGYAGRHFIKHMADHNVREIFSKWENLFKDQTCNISGKHQMSLSVILTADELVNRMFFGMNEIEAHSDTKEFYTELSKIMISTPESDLTTRAYEFIVNWIASNNGKFAENTNEVWGKYSPDNTTIYIISNPLRKALEENKFNFESVLKGLSERGLLVKPQESKKNIKQFRLGNGKVTGIELKLPSKE